MRHNLLLLSLVSVFSLGAQAQTPVVRKPLADIWSNQASIFLGVRGGIAVPPGAVGLAPNIALELGVAVPHGFGFGIRAMWMNNPPGVPFLGLGPSAFGFGALADFRYYIETVDPLIIYPTISVGFLAGPEKISQMNAVMPLFNPGLGVKMKFGNVYGAFEFGLSGFTIPFVVFILGFDGDSKLTKEAERIRIAEETAPIPVAPVAAPVAPRGTP
jgi:hypothetical protein